MTNLPVSGKFKITCEYGRKGNNWKCGRHTGIDFVSEDKKVYGTCDGKVSHAGYDRSYGNYVVVKSNESDTFHWFCHLDERYVQIGDKVSRLTLIGLMGMTGNASGVHLHFEIRKKCNCYGYDKTENPASYCKVPNRVIEDLDSKDFQISSKLKQGNKILVPVKYTGAETNSAKLIELENRQMWIYKSTVVDDKFIQATICWIEENRIMIEVDSTENENCQLWIDKSLVKE